MLQNPNCLDYNSREERCELCSNFTSFTDKVFGNPICAFVDEACARYNVWGSCVSCPIATHFLRRRNCILIAENCQSINPLNR